MTSRTLLRSAPATVFVLALVACGGSNGGDIAPPGGSTTIIQGDDSGSPSSSGGGSGGGGDNGGGTGDDASSPGTGGGDDSGSPANDSGSGGGDDGGTNGNPEAGTVADGGNDPAPSTCPSSGAVMETESNDTVGKANTFTSVACGSIDPVGDVDYWKFTLAQNATSIHIAYHGSVTLEVTSKGSTVTIPGNQPVPFNPGSDYTIKVTASAGGTQPYTLLVE